MIYQNNLIQKKVPALWVLLHSTAIIVLELLSEVVLADLPNNLFLYHFFSPIEWLLLANYFRLLLIKPLIKKILLLSIWFFLFYSLYISIFIQHLTENNDLQLLTQGAMQISCCMFYYQQILTKEIHTPAHKNPYFWITSAILFYSVNQFFIEGLLSLLTRIDTSNATKWYMTGFIFKYFMCILTFIGIIILNKKKFV